MGKLDSTEAISPAESERVTLLWEASIVVSDLSEEILRDGFAKGNRKALERAMGRISAAAELLESNRDIDPLSIARSAANRRRSIRKKLIHQNDQAQYGRQASLFEELTA
jgi:hypothetical protein